MRSKLLTSKCKIALSILALSVVGSAPLHAQEAVTSADNAPVQAISQDADKTGSIGRMDELNTELAESIILASKLENEVRIKKLQDELNKDVVEQKVREQKLALEREFAQKEDAYQKELARLSTELRQKEFELRKMQAEILRASSKDVNNQIFVTNVFGVGMNLTASVYFDDKIIEVRDGMALTDNVSVKNIRSNGVMFEISGKDKFIALTNEEYAFSKAFNKEAAQALNNNPSKRF